MEREKVLVVDDSPDAAELMAILLREAGHDVRTAGDGPSALAAARAFHPRVVFLDIGLPGMSGYEVAQALRAEHGASMLLVALTGFGHEEARERSRAAGFDRHELKPLDIDGIEAVIRAVFEGLAAR